MLPPSKKKRERKNLRKAQHAEDLAQKYMRTKTFPSMNLMRCIYKLIKITGFSSSANTVELKFSSQRSGKHQSKHTETALDFSNL